MRSLVSIVEKRTVVRAHVRSRACHIQRIAPKAAEFSVVHLPQPLPQFHEINLFGIEPNAHKVGTPEKLF